MTEQVQIIERDGKPEWAVLPYDLYLQLAEEAEMLEDIRDYDAIKLPLYAAKKSLSLAKWSMRYWMVKTRSRSGANIVVSPNSSWPKPPGSALLTCRKSRRTNALEQPRYSLQSLKRLNLLLMILQAQAVISYKSI